MDNHAPRILPPLRDQLHDTPQAKPPLAAILPVPAQQQQPVAPSRRFSVGKLSNFLLTPKKSNTEKDPHSYNAANYLDVDDYVHKLIKRGPMKDIVKSLSKNDEFHAMARTVFFKLLNFKNIGIDSALRSFLFFFELPHEAQEIDRIIQSFASKYYADNPKMFDCQDVTVILAMSLLVLNSDLHNPRNRTKMTRQQYMKNTMQAFSEHILHCSAHSENRPNVLSPDILDILFENGKTASFTLATDSEDKTRGVMLLEGVKSKTRWEELMYKDIRFVFSAFPFDKSQQHTDSLIHRFITQTFSKGTKSHLDPLDEVDMDEKISIAHAAKLLFINEISYAYPERIEIDPNISEFNDAASTTSTDISTTTFSVGSKRSIRTLSQYSVLPATTHTRADTDSRFEQSHTPRRHSAGAAIMKIFSGYHSKSDLVSSAASVTSIRSSRASFLAFNRQRDHSKSPEPNIQNSPFHSLSSFPSTIRNSMARIAFKSPTSGVPILPKIPNATNVVSSPLSQSPEDNNSIDSITTEPITKDSKKEIIVQALLHAKFQGMLSVKRDLNERGEKSGSRKWISYWAMLSDSEVILFREYHWFIQHLMEKGVPKDLSSIPSSELKAMPNPTLTISLDQVVSLWDPLYQRRSNVLRLCLPSRLQYLLQTSTQLETLKWNRLINCAATYKSMRIPTNSQEFPNRGEAIKETLDKLASKLKALNQQFDAEYVNHNHLMAIKPLCRMSRQILVNCFREHLRVLKMIKIEVEKVKCFQHYLEID